MAEAVISWRCLLTVESTPCKLKFREINPMQEEDSFGGFERDPTFATNSKFGLPLRRGECPFGVLVFVSGFESDEGPKYPDRSVCSRVCMEIFCRISKKTLERQSGIWPKKIWGNTLITRIREELFRPLV